MVENVPNFRNPNFDVGNNHSAFATWLLSVCSHVLSVSSGHQRGYMAGLFDF